ncbi:MAG: CpaF family protein, partial [Lachnospiraceae bacterium]|nr:CpaF family protein [Lachnospiraceae bacterium]
SQIASGVDIIIHLGRQQDHKRRVVEIDEMLGYEDGRFILNQLYVSRKCEGGYRLEATGKKLCNTWKLEMIENEI